jgi:hypothetical protein
MVCAVFRAVWQTDGWTPLLAASYFGHVECVRTLLGGGAEINKATVGCACSMGGAVCMGMFGSLCAAGRVRWDAARLRARAICGRTKLTFAGVGAP